MTIKPLTSEYRESQRGPAAEDEAKISSKDGGDKRGSENGGDSERGGTDNDTAECHESVELRSRPAKMSQKGPQADDDAKIFSKDGSGNVGKENCSDPSGEERDKPGIDGDNASVSSGSIAVMNGGANGSKSKDDRTPINLGDWCIVWGNRFIEL